MAIPIGPLGPEQLAGLAAIAASFEAAFVLPVGKPSPNWIQWSPCFCRFVFGWEGSEAY